MKNQILSALCAIAFVVLLTPVLQAGEEVVEEHRVKVMIAEDGADTEIIRVDDLDLEIGESRSIISDSGKDILIIRTDEGLSVTVDGEEIGLPSMQHLHGDHSDHQDHGDHHIEIVERIIGSDSGNGETMVFVTRSEDGSEIDTDVRKIIVGHGGGSKKVFISEDGKTVELNGEQGFEWTGLSHMIEMIGGSDLTEHLQESGALDELSEQQRQKILDAIEAYKKQAHSSAHVIKMELDSDEEH